MTNTKKKTIPHTFTVGAVLRLKDGFRGTSWYKGQTLSVQMAAVSVQENHLAGYSHIDPREGETVRQFEDRVAPLLRKETTLELTEPERVACRAMVCAHLKEALWRLDVHTGNLISQLEIDDANLRK